MSAPAWMPFYVADYLADTGHLSTVEHGAYMLLIMHYWQNSGLPTEDHKLARIARLSPAEWQEIKATLVELFDDDWTHKRIDAEIAKAAETIGKRKAAGKAGASARYGKGNATASATAKQTHAPNGVGEGNSEDISSTSPKEARPRATHIGREFAEVFYPAYPHKVQRAAALKAWPRARSKATLEQIMAGLQRYIRDKPPDRHWQNPATFLNGESWNDQPASPPIAANAKPGPHSTILRSIARAVEKRSGLGVGETDADERLPLDRQGSPEAGIVAGELASPPLPERH